MTVPTKAYVLREFKRFLRLSGLDKTGKEVCWAMIKEMRKTAQARGMSKYEMETLYDADELLEIYHETIKRRH